MEDLIKRMASLEQQFDFSDFFDRINSRTASMHAELAQGARDKQENIAALNHLGDVSRGSLASVFRALLEQQIKRFDSELDQEHEVGVKLVTYGPAVTIHVSHLGYQDPSLIFFFGRTEDGDKVQLIQHVSQISFLLVALPKLNPNEPKRPFGYERWATV